jgi:hypothetical protein
VEFSLELTNEEFKQKLGEIYPKLENACFVLMKADRKNKLEELDPGTRCFRCYTPRNIYHSNRGQGRLYIRIIAENEVILTRSLGYNKKPDADHPARTAYFISLAFSLVKYWSEVNCPKMT